MAHPIINYRNPATAAGTRLLGIREHLRRRDQFLKIKVALLLATGLPALFIGPIVLASIYWLLALLLFKSFFISWCWFFWGSFLILVPLLFWTERRTRGHFFVETVAEVNPNGSSIAPLAAIALGNVGLLIGFAANPRLATSGLVEVFLWGPRLVLDAADKLRRAQFLRGVNVERAADVLVQLQASERGIPTTNLLRPGETLKTLVPVLAYLVFHDWVGVSKAGDRIWLASDARKALG